MVAGGSGVGNAGDMRERLRSALREAIAARDAVAVSALRSALAAIGNAEAVPAPHDRVARSTSAYIAGAAASIGAVEVARRSISEADVKTIIGEEIADRLEAADAFDRRGHVARARRLRREAEILDAITDQGGLTSESG